VIMESEPAFPLTPVYSPGERENAPSLRAKPGAQEIVERGNSAPLSPTRRHYAMPGLPREAPSEAGERDRVTSHKRTQITQKGLFVVRALARPVSAGLAHGGNGIKPALRTRSPLLIFCVSCDFSRLYGFLVPSPLRSLMATFPALPSCRLLETCGPVVEARAKVAKRNATRCHHPRSVRQNSSLMANGACSLSSRGTMEERAGERRPSLLGSPSPSPSPRSCLTERGNPRSVTVYVSS
jgi:hypothetical protein